MGKIVDLTGRRFGRWTVVEFVEINKNHKAVWLCECECKTKKWVISSNLLRGDSQSCGCKSIENKIKHGKSYDRIYGIYRDMKYRCTNENNSNYSKYGSRGIRVCGDWLDEKEGFINFYNWSIENGYSDELTIDRIDVNGNYEPSNCRWATMKVQQNNKRNNNYITINGEKRTTTEWAELFNINAGMVIDRLNRGWEQSDLFINPKERAERQSGIKGITWHKKYNSWQVNDINYKPKKYIGKFIDLDHAIKALEESRISDE